MLVVAVAAAVAAVAAASTDNLPFSHVASGSDWRISSGVVVGDDSIEVKASAGTFPSTGYVVTVERVFVLSSRPRQWCVVIDVRRPDPRLAQGAAMTHPYHWVRVAPSDVRAAPPRAWAVVASDGSARFAGAGGRAHRCEPRML